VGYSMLLPIQEIQKKYRLAAAFRFAGEQASFSSFIVFFDLKMNKKYMINSISIFIAGC
jgi:hypothetical protein